MKSLSEKEIQETLGEFERIAKEKVPSRFSNRDSGRYREFNPLTSEEFWNEWDPVTRITNARIQKWRY